MLVCLYIVLFLSFKTAVNEECEEMVIPWQLCRTIGPLTFHSQEIGLFCGDKVHLALVQNTRPASIAPNKNSFCRQYICVDNSISRFGPCPYSA